MKNHGTPHWYVLVHRLTISIVCTDILTHSTVGCTDKPICIAYTSLISDRYISFILSGTLWYDEPYGKVKLHH